MIIIEGMDNSGKSTLAKKLGLKTIHPGPAPESDSIELECMEYQLSIAQEPVIMDRITCISQQVYQNRLFDSKYTAFLHRMLSTPKCIVVYCRPPKEVILNFESHCKKSYDTEESINNLIKNGSALIDRYDELMKTIPNIKYDFTKFFMDLAIPTLLWSQL